MKLPKILTGSKDSNVIVSLVKPESKRCKCRKCGKLWHYADAVYCSQCGEKIGGNQ